MKLPILASRSTQPLAASAALIRSTWLWSSIAVLSGLTGCAVGPDFKSPDEPQVDHYTAQSLPEKTVATAVPGGNAQTFTIGKELPAQWWTLFGSDKLDALVSQAFANSPTTAAARAALKQAEENLTAQRGAYFPSVDAHGSATRQKTNTSSLGATTPTESLYNLYNASVSVAYTLDIFGGVRRSVEAQAALTEAQRFELQATYLTLAANVVTASVSTASLRDQLAATKDIVAAQEKQLEIAEKRHQLGAIAYADVLAAQSNLASVRATLPALEKQYGAVQNQLAVYLGKLPSEFNGGDFDLAELQLPSEIPLSVPAQLVRQRPDVRAAEARLHQASALIGVATANLLPQVSITGSFGSQATESAQLFKDKIWSIGAGVTQPLFHGGALTAKRRAAIAAYDEAAADYRLAVLTAYQNVADALTALQSDAQALQAQYVAMSSAKESLALVERQYALGSVSYINLLTAQRQYQQSRVSYSQALASRYQDTAALFQALGGKWDEAALTATAEKNSSSVTTASTPESNPEAQNAKPELKNNEQQ
ncbi:MAG: efflux transporter outer membrane subunit [Spongiibacteraceae bacterium]